MTGVVGWLVRVAVLLAYAAGGALAFGVTAAVLGVAATLLGFGAATSQTLFIGVLVVGALIGALVGCVHMLIFGAWASETSTF